MAISKSGAPAASKPFSPSSEHMLTIGQATQAVLAGTVTVYGKIVKGISFSPSDAGTTHPQGKDEDLHLSVVYGIQDQGQCTPLATPQKVYLPSPDGPADGCGWDPKEYVVWKNLPKDWETVHVQSQSKPLAAALQATAPAIQPVSCQEIVEQWANLSNLPGRNDDLKSLWGASGDALAWDFNAGAAKLAALLRPQARPGQTIDQRFILGLNPSTVGQLATQLGF